MRNHYWSCSKFADCLRGTPKPSAGTAEEWHAWGKAAKAKKVRYWLAEVGLDFLQNLVYFPSDLKNKAFHYVNNRWISKTHALTSNLKRGQWHEFEARLLHATFDELVNFVEIELASRFMADSKPKTPWYRKIFQSGLQRCPEAGLAHLEWASGLKTDEDWVDKEDPSYGQPTSQALASQQIIALYKWWKIERLKRLDPMDSSGWSDYCEERRRASKDQDDDLSWLNCDVDQEERERSRKILNTSHKIENEQEDEDTEMLIRLIKIRGSLWS